MQLSHDQKYKFFYSLEGKLICVNRASDGCTVYIPDSNFYDPTINPSTAEFLAGNYDLSDQPVFISGLRFPPDEIDQNV